MTRDQARELLGYIRACAEQYEKDGTFGKNAIDGFLRLDDHLAGGGPLPEQWQAAAVS
jgi:hypothetical protein